MINLLYPVCYVLLSPSLFLSAALPFTPLLAFALSNLHCLLFYAAPPTAKPFSLPTFKRALSLSLCLLCNNFVLPTFQRKRRQKSLRRQFALN